MYFYFDLKLISIFYAHIQSLLYKKKRLKSASNKTLSFANSQFKQLQPLTSFESMMLSHTCAYKNTWYMTWLNTARSYMWPHPHHLPLFSTSIDFTFKCPVILGSVHTIRHLNRHKRKVKLYLVSLWSIILHWCYNLFLLLGKAKYESIWYITYKLHLMHNAINKISYSSWKKYTH